jgi:hypothetical protein
MAENLPLPQDADSDGNVFKGFGVALIFNLILAAITCMLMHVFHIHVLAAFVIALAGMCLIGLRLLR